MHFIDFKTPKNIEILKSHKFLTGVLTVENLKVNHFDTGLLPCMIHYENVHIHQNFNSEWRGRGQVQVLEGFH